MVTMTKKSQSMQANNPPVAAFEDVFEMNRLFLEFLREREQIAISRFGMSLAIHRVLRQAQPADIDRAAQFPRALFRLSLPHSVPAVQDSFDLMRRSSERVLELVLLHGARNLCRRSGYAARLQLGLLDADVRRLREADVKDLVALSVADSVVFAAFDRLHWLWRELLSQSRPDSWRQLLLIGLQPSRSFAALSRSA